MPEEIEVPTEHLHEKMEEEAHHGGGGWISRVAVSSALLAVVAAISALLAGHHANEAMFEEMKATDQWSLYQSKGIKQSQLETKIVMLSALKEPVPADAEGKLKDYDKDKAEIMEKAKELDESAEAHMGHHVWYAAAVTAFQIAIALGAIAVLAKRPKLWFVSVALGAIGSVFMVIGIV
jgi:hypothetical protein